MWRRRLSILLLGSLLNFGLPVCGYADTQPTISDPGASGSSGSSQVSPQQVAPGAALDQQTLRQQVQIPAIPSEATVLLLTHPLVPQDVDLVETKIYTDPQDGSHTVVEVLEEGVQIVWSYNLNGTLVGYGIYDTQGRQIGPASGGVSIRVVQSKGVPTFSVRAPSRKGSRKAKSMPVAQRR